MAAAKNPLQTLSRRAGNYAPKAAPSPSLLGAPAPTGTEDGAKGRRGAIRSGTARGGRAATSARQGQLPFGLAETRQETQVLQVAEAQQQTEAQLKSVAPQETEAPQETGAPRKKAEEVADQAAAETEQVVDGTAKRVLARETVVIRRRTVVVERASSQGTISATGLRSPAKPALRRIVLAEVDAHGSVAVAGADTVSAADRKAAADTARAVVTRESLPAPRRDIPIVLEAVGTVAITVLGLAALFFLG